MIYTITLNPSIDYVMFTDGFETGALNRAQTTYKFAGGKGINVSRVLKSLNTESTVLGFLGGFPGQFIKDKLQASNIQVDCVEVESDTRINVKLKGMSETEINAPGPDINEENIVEMGEARTHDLYLDVLVLPDGRYELVDEADVKRALKKQVITQAQYDLAYKTAQEVMDEVKDNFTRFEQLASKCKAEIKTERT